MKTTSEKRFKFGANWLNYVRIIDEKRILEAEKSLVAMLGRKNLMGLSFLDIGSGSGLFSLAARRLGATVHSFDYDSDSVEASRETKRRFLADDPHWAIEQGSVLDKDYLSRLGQFDVVYSWGVLHHTGSMWKALENVTDLVRKNGLLFIAIYNDQGETSVWWWRVKYLYVTLPFPFKQLFLFLVVGYQEGRVFVIRSLKTIYRAFRFRPLKVIWAKSPSERGMNHFYDWIDWVGGYPFEVADPEQIFKFYRDRGFTLTEMVCRTTGYGCNEFVFRKN